MIDKVAKIENGIVKQVFLGELSLFEEQEGDYIDATGIEVGVGYTYNNNEIRPPKPFESWIYESQKWNPPIEKPSDDDKWIWDEDLLDWTEYIRKGYRIWNYEKDVLLRQTMSDGSKYNPVKDHKGDYFIFEQEFKQCGLGVLTEYFAPIMDEII